MSIQNQSFEGIEDAHISATALEATELVAKEHESEPEGSQSTEHETDNREPGTESREHGTEDRASIELDPAELVQKVGAAIEAVRSGDPDAIAAMEEVHGARLEELLAGKLGVAVGDLDLALASLGQAGAGALPDLSQAVVTPPLRSSATPLNQRGTFVDPPTQSFTVSGTELSLEDRVAAIEEKERAGEWVAKYGGPIARFVEQSEFGLKLSPDVFYRARHLLPSSPSAELFIQAAMQSDPAAVMAAQRATKPREAPSHAVVGKSGKVTATVDADALLNDPMKFEEFLG